MNLATQQVRAAATAANNPICPGARQAGGLGFNHDGVADSLALPPQL